MKFGRYAAALVTDVWELLFAARLVVLCMTAWFALSVAIGYATAPSVVPELRSEIRSPTELARFRPILWPKITYRRSELRDPSLIRLALILFVHNALAIACVLYLGGVLIIFPPLSIFVHAWSCGAVLEQGGYQTLLHRTIPHAFIEIPMMLCASSIATLLALRFYAAMRRSIKLGGLGFFRDATRTWVVCMPFLFISAVLETYGTRLLWGQ